MYANVEKTKVLIREEHVDVLIGVWFGHSHGWAQELALARCHDGRMGLSIALRMICEV